MDEMKLRIVSEYKMPPLCCSCGAPAGKAQFKVYASSTRQFRPYSLYLPLCDDCAHTYSTVDQRRRVGCWIGLVLAVVLVAGVVLGKLLGADTTAWDTRLFILALLVIVLGMASFLIIPRLLSRSLRDPYHRIVHAAQIKHYSPSGLLGEGSMVLCLAQPAFAEQFLLLNKQMLWREPGR